MPSKSEHLDVARENVAAMRHLHGAGDRFARWMTTTVFYAAVHVVEAVFAEIEGSHSENHHERNARLRGDRRYRNLWQHYKRLLRESMIARYLESDHPRANVDDFRTAEAVIRELHGHHLKQIVASAGRLIGETIDLEPQDTTAP